MGEVSFFGFVPEISGWRVSESGEFRVLMTWLSMALRLVVASKLAIDKPASFQ